MRQRSRRSTVLLALTLAAAAAFSRQETKPPAANGEKAPAPAGDPVRGAVTYRVFCSVCHGRSGRGDGALAESLRQPPADLTRLASRNGGVFDAEKVRQSIDGRDEVIPHGDSDMPVWGVAFQQGTDLESPDGKVTEEEARARIADLVAYLATLQVSEKE
jgi:mono/diheme cytochrome c family protein